jgi:hypothetical protein
MLLRAGLVYGNTEAGVLASGPVVRMIDDLPGVAELIVVSARLPAQGATASDLCMTGIPTPAASSPIRPS